MFACCRMHTQTDAWLGNESAKLCRCASCAGARAPRSASLHPNNNPLNLQRAGPAEVHPSGPYSRGTGPPRGLLLGGSGRRLRAEAAGSSRGRLWNRLRDR